MSKRVRIGGIVGGIVAILLGLFGAAPAVFATPSQASASPTIHLFHKVILQERSIDGPALSSAMDNFEGVHFITTIAWTGTDSLHHINLIQSPDDPANGVTHFKNKKTLSELSFARPAVAQFAGGLGNTAVAWVGTDKAHTLNFEWNAYGSNADNGKVTLWGETSIGAPALVRFRNSLILAWTGSDVNHSLNVMPFNMSTLKFGPKTVLRQFTSLAGPNLAVFGVTAGPELALTWTTKALALNNAVSTDGVHFPPVPALGPDPEFSANAPSAFYHRADVGERAYRAWTGIDAVHHINIQWSTSFPEWPNAATSRYVLGETALGGPQIALNDGFLIAWTGTNAAHNLNIATWDLF